MTITEATRLLQEDLDNPGCVPIERLNQAQTLGIEALQHLYSQNDPDHQMMRHRLPSETED